MDYRRSRSGSTSDRSRCGNTSDRSRSGNTSAVSRLNDAPLPLRLPGGFTQRTRGTLVIALLLLAGFFTATPALGQGAMGMMPDPIATSDLIRYLRRCDLSSEQMLAIETLHADYKASFRELRDGPIAEFLEAVSQQSGDLPEREAWDRLWELHADALGKVKTLERTFFDGFAAVMTDEQLALLPRVRSARDRDRLRGQQFMMVGGSAVMQVEFADVVLDAGLTPAQLSAIDPMVASYERKLNKFMNDTADDAMDFYRSLLDQMEAAAASPDDPAVQEAASNAYGEHMMIQAQSMAAFTDDAYKAFKQFEGLVDAEAYMALEDEFYPRLFPEIASGYTIHAANPLRSAATIDWLSDQEQAQIKAANLELRQRQRMIVGKMIELSLERSAQRNPMAWDAEGEEAFMQQISEQQARLQEIMSDAEERLVAIVGTEARDRIRDTATGTEGGPGSPIAPEIMATETTALQYEWGGDAWLPAPITQRTLATYVSFLDLRDDQELLVDEFHARYLETFAAETQADISSMNELAQQMWAEDSDTEGIIEKTYKLRHALRDRIIEIDSRFFDDLAVAVIDDEQRERFERVRTWRRIETFDRNTGGYGYGGPSAGNVKMLALFAVQRKAASSPEFEAIAADYETAVLPLLKERLMKGMAMQAEMERWSRAFQTNHDNEQLAVDYQKAMAEVQESMAVTNGAIRSLNESTISRLETAVEDPTAFIDAYRQQAYPEVYGQSSLIEPLERSLALEDLDDRQQTKLSEMLLEYRGTRATMCDKMITIIEKRNELMAAQDWTSWQDIEGKLARIRFDRSELDATMTRKLKTILSEEQIEAIGGLPEPMQDRTDYWYGG